MMVFEELDRGQPKRPSQLAGYEETDGRQQCLEGFSSTAYVKINDDRLSTMETGMVEVKDGVFVRKRGQI